MSGNRARVANVTLLHLLCVCLPLLAQVNITPRLRRTPAPESRELATNLRVDSSLALIPALVTTILGTPVADLNKDDFRIFENGAEQSITYFGTEDAPVSVGLLLDTSGSMQNKMQKSLQAAAQLFKASNVQDEFFLMEFNGHPTLSVPFTSDSEELSRRIARTRPFGRTSLYDAVYLALAQMKKARHARKALVILSDGGDNRSRHNFREIKRILVESDVQVYALGIFDPGTASSRAPEEVNGPQLLNELAEESGGRHFPVSNLNDLPEAAAQIGIELRSQYVLGYSPSNNERDGKYRRVSVKLVPETSGPPLRVDFRRGYYAPVD